jgi:acyl-CoA thioesterase
VKLTPPGPLCDLLGIRTLTLADGSAIFGLSVRHEHMNPYGVIHGGVVYSLVDTAMGAALHSRMEPGETCATLEIKINYLAPVTGGDLRAEARVLQRTRRVGVLEGRVTGDGGALVAAATGTFYIQTVRSE